MRELKCSTDIQNKTSNFYFFIILKKKNKKPQKKQKDLIFSLFKTNKIIFVSLIFFPFIDSTQKFITSVTQLLRKVT